MLVRRPRLLLLDFVAVLALASVRLGLDLQSVYMCMCIACLIETQVQQQKWEMGGICVCGAVCVYVRSRSHCAQW